jgi:signal transduction histidine kinase/FixJ family two-component response regulator
LRATFPLVLAAKREDLHRQLAHRLLRAQPTALAAHAVLIVAVVAFLGGTAPTPSLIGWAVALVVAVTGRALGVRALGRRGLDPVFVLRRVRWLVAASGLAWGLGTAVLAPQILPRWWALLLVLLSGLGSNASVTLDADPPAFRGFLAGLLGPLPFGILATGQHREQWFALFLIGFFAAFVVALNRRLHVALVRHLQTQEALVDARNVARRAERTQAAFLANMSHEIRTPMNAILGLTGLVLDTDLPAEHRRQLGLVHGAAEGLLTILNDILDFSKIEGEHLDLERVPIDLVELAHTTIGLFQARAGERDVRLRAELASDIPVRVRGDPGRLRQVLTNLLGNALKFTEHGDVTLTVAVARRTAVDAVVAFAVSDTGIGIPAEKLTSIFEAFSQADASVTRKYGGTGLGLAISQRLVRLMGGEIEVRSRLGQGSEFRFAILVELEPESSAVANPPVGAGLATPAARRSLRVLLAEDNPVNQEVAATVLRKRGHRVDIVGDGREAVAAATRERYDVVLMDVQMPEMDGLAATRAIRVLPEGRGQRIIALTAHASGAERERCLAAGMNGYLTKPFKSQDLFALVEERSISQPAAVDAVDIEGFRAMMRDAGAEEAVDGIVRLFTQGAAARLEAIGAAIQAGDAGAIERAAHAFKSAAATVGARGLAERLAAVEQAGREGAADRAADELPALREAVAAVLTQLEGGGHAHPRR